MHKKYTYKDNKRYGPYLYETKRVHGKIVTSYLGPESRFVINFSKIFILIAFIFITIALFFVIFSVYNYGLSGRVVFDISLKYKPGEKIGGDLKFRIKEGELVPVDSLVVINYANQSKSFKLHEIVPDLPTSGNFYAESVSLTGKGDGYGVVGRKITYPTLSFKILVYTDGKSIAKNIDDSVGSKDSDIDSTNEDGVQNKNEQDESDKLNSGDDLGIGLQDGITDSSIKDDSYTIDASVSYDRPFEYSLKPGQKAKIVEGSVKIGDKELPDKSISLDVKRQKIKATTRYFVSQEGFGPEFLGEYALVLNIDVEKLNLYAVPGTLSVLLVYNDIIIAQQSENIRVVEKTEDILEENRTIVLIKKIPSIRIAQGAEARINLLDYFEGADSYSLEVKNIVPRFVGNELILQADEGFRGARLAKLVARSGNNILESNEFSILVSSGALKLTTGRDMIKVGEPVRWEKKIEPDSPGNFVLDVPKEAYDLVVKKIDQTGIETIVARHMSETNANSELIERAGIGTGTITGDVIIEIDVKKQPSFIRKIKRFIAGITGRAVGIDSNKEVEFKEILINAEEGVVKYIIEYYTPAPETFEKETAKGKQIIVSAPDVFEYTDIIASTSINESRKIRDSSMIQLYWYTNETVTKDEIKKVATVPAHEIVEEFSEGEMNDSLSLLSDFSKKDIDSSPILRRVPVPFDAYDLDQDGIIDYIEWVVPHLSNQTYEIIYITKALHLDSNRSIINDITDTVKYLDNNWSESIPDSHYIRVTFERNLSSRNDITIYPRVVDGNPRVEVYEKDQDVLLALFENIVNDRYTSIYLTNLSQEHSQDVFDLRIVGGTLIFDHIVDPTILVSNNVSDIALVAINNETVVVVYNNKSGGSTVMFRVVNLASASSNNPIIVDRQPHSTVPGNFSRVGAAPVNSTMFWVGFTNATARSDVRVAYDPTGNIIVPQAVGDGAIGVSSYDIALTTMGNDRFAYCYIDQEEDDFDLRMYNLVSGAAIGSETTFNEEISAVENLINKIDCVAINSSRGIAFGYDSGIDDNAVYYFFDANGALIGNEGVIENKIGDYGQVAVASLNRNRVALFWYHSDSFMLRMAILSVNDDIILPPTDLFMLHSGDPNEEQQMGIRLAAATVKNLSSGLDNVVIVFKDMSNLGEHGTGEIKAAIYNSSGAQVVAPFLIDPSPALTTSFAALGEHDSVEYGICPGTFVVAYENSTGSLLLKSYWFNGSEWSGICNPDVSPPLISFVSPTPLNGSVQSRNSIFVNVSTSDASDHYAFVDFNRDLLLWLRMDDLNASRDPIDLSSWGRNASRVSGSNITNTPTTGTIKYNSTLVIDQLSVAGFPSLRVNLNLSNFASNQGTISFWIWHNETLPGLDFAPVLTTGDANGYGIHFYTINSQARYYVELRNSSGSTVPLSESHNSYTAYANNWTHYVVVWNKGNFARLYRNSVNISNVANYNISIAGGDVLRIGTNIWQSDYNQYFLFDELLIFNRSLTQSEINSLYNASANKYRNNFTNLQDGNYNFVGYAVDVMAQKNQTEQRTVTIDTSAPTAQYVSPTQNSGANLSRNYIEVNVTATDTNLQTILIRLYNSTHSLINSSLTSTSPNYVNFSGLSDGVYYYNATANDTAGNIAHLATRTITLDTIRPLVTIVYPLNITYNTSVTSFNYTFVELNPRTCSYVLIQGMLVIDEGEITCGNNVTGLPIGQGQYTIELNITDIANNTNSTSVTFFVDTIAPTIQFVNPTEANNSLLIRNNILINVTSTDANLANITIELHNTTSLVNRTVRTSSPNFVNITNLPDGIYYFNATATDVANNRNSTVTRTVTIDTSAPTAQYVSPTQNSGANLSRNYIEVNVTATDTNLQTILIRLYNSTHSLINSSLTSTSPNYVNFSGLSDGVYYYNATANDTAGNIAHLATRTITLDTIRPLVTIVYPLNITYNTSVTSFNYTFVELNPRTCSYVLIQGMLVIDEGEITCGNNVTGLPIGQGQYTIELNITDIANNTNSTSVTFFVDTIAPTIQFVNPTEANNSLLIRNNILINVTSTDANLANITIELHNTTSLVNRTVRTSSPNFVNITNLPDGIYYFNATATDVANNRNSTVTRTVTIDTSAPTAQYVSPTQNSGANLSRNYIEVNVTATDTNLQTILIRLYNSTHSLINSSLTSTSPNYVNFSGLSDGVYYYNATANDTAGNIAHLATRTITLDTIRPLVTIVYPLNITYNTSVTSFNYTFVELNPRTCSYVLIQGMLVIDEGEITCGNNVTGLPIGQGQYTIELNITDIANNTNSTSVTFFVDTIAPTIQFVNPTEANNSLLIRNNILINVTSTDANLANITIELHNTTSLVNRTVRTSSPNFVNITNLPDGIYYFNATATDVANNRNSTVTRTVTIDTSAPTAQYVSPTQNSGANLSRNYIEVNVTATDTNLQTILIRLYNSTHSLINSSLTSTSPNYVNFSGLSDGVYYYNATANDTAGNIAHLATRTITLDTIRPLVTIVYPLNITYNTSVTSFNYTFVELNPRTCSYVLIQGMLVIDEGEITCGNNVTGLPIGQGQYTIELNITDIANNTNSTSVTFFVDTIAPTIQFVNPTEANNSLLIRNNILINVTSTDANLANITIELHNTTSLVNRTVRTSSPNFVNITNLPDGIYYFNATATDVANNRNSTVTRTVTIDTSAPTAQYVSPTQNSGANLSRNYIEVNVTATDTNLQTILIRLYNSTHSLINSSLTSTSPNYVNFSGLSDGVYYYNATANDTAGNIAHLATRTITLDTIRPLVTIVYPLNITYNTSVTSFNYTFVELNPRTCSYVLIQGMLVIDEGEITCGNNVTGLPIGQGQYTIELNITDIANNTNSTSVTFFVDTIAPTIQFVNPTEANNSLLIRNNILINVTSTDANLANITIELHNTTSLVNRTVRTSSPNFVNITNLPDGIYYFNATATDVANNRNSTVTRTVTIDTSAPTAQYVSPTQNSGANLSRNYIEVNVTATDTNLQTILIRLYNSTHSLINSSLTSTSPNYVNFSGLSDGVYYYNATANDTAGNIAHLATRTITLDTIRPLVTIVYPLNITYNTSVTSFNYTFVELNPRTCSYVLIQGMLVIDEGEITCGNNVTGLPIGQGQYTIELNITDIANNTNSTSVTFFVDTIAPTIQFVNPTEANNSLLIRNNILINVTSTDANLANITIELHNTTSLVNRTVRTSSPNFVNITNLPDGIYYFNATATDVANNRNSTVTRTVTIDTSAPTAQYVSPTQNSGANLSRNYIEVNVTATDTNLQTILIRLYNSTHSLINSSLTSTSPNYVNFSGLSDGVYYYNATANDTAGNIAHLATRTITLDTIRPLVTIVYPLNITYNTSVTSFNYTFVELNPRTCSYVLIQGMLVIDEGEITCGNNVTGLPIGQGQYTIELNITDIANNTNSTSVTFFVDTIAPTIQFVNPTEANNSLLIRNNILINVTSTDANLANITIELHNTTSLVNRTVRTSSPNFVNITNLPDGIYYFNATATDVANNRNSTVTRTVTIDTSAPTAQYVSPTQNSGANLSRNYIEVNVTATDTNLQTILIRLYNSTHSLINSSLTSTSPNYVNFSGLSDGVYYYNATANDTAGNIAHLATRTITLDTIRPLVTIVYPLNITYNTSVTSFNYTFVELNPRTCSYVLIQGMLVIDEGEITCGNNVTGLPIGQGQYTIELNITDIANNTNSTSVTFFVDTIAPTIQFVNPTEANNSLLIRNNILINVTSTDANLANITIELHNTTSLVNRTVRTSSPNFVNITNLPDGIYYFNATATDVANNRNSTVTRTVTIDTSAPTAQYVSPTQNSGANLSRNYIEVNVTATDTNLQTILIRLYNSTHSLINSSLTSTSPNYVNFSGLSDGVYYYNATANDTAGNIAHLATRTITLDTIRPLVTIVYPLNITYNTSVTSFNYTFVELNPRTCSYVLIQGMLVIDEGEITCGNNVTGLPIGQGQYTIELNITDIANNTNSTSVTFFVDTIAPTNLVFNISSDSNNSYVSRRFILVNASVTEINLANITIYIFNSTGGVVNSSSSNSNINPYFGNLTVNSDGVYYVNFSATDFAGNTNFSQTRIITIDTLRPLISYGIGTENSGEVLANISIYVNVSLTEINFANITFTLLNSTSIVNQSSFTTPTYTINFTNLPAGLYRYVVNATDLANNRNDTGFRQIRLVPSCLSLCPEESACTLTHANCYLYSDMCTGGVCDFINLTLQNSTIYTLYNASNDGNLLVMNISSNSSTSVRFIQNGTFIFWGKNGTTIGSGSLGGRAGIVNITTAGLFNRTNSRFLGMGGYSSVAGAGGRGGVLQLNYHGLIGIDDSGVWIMSLAGGNSVNSTSGADGIGIFIKDNVCPLDPDLTNDGAIDSIDVSEIKNRYGSVITSPGFNPIFDINCDGIINVIDLSRIGFQWGRGVKNLYVMYMT